MPTNYDKTPYFNSGLSADECTTTWNEIASLLTSHLDETTWTICVECYPGAFDDEIEAELCSRLRPTRVIRARDSYKDVDQLQSQFEQDLSHDPVFGRISEAQMIDFFDQDRLQATRSLVQREGGRILVIGTGAALLVPASDRLVYADMARWEIQRRQRANLVGNLGMSNLAERSSDKHKRAFFLDWRVADRVKPALLKRADWILDANCSGNPKMLTGDTFRDALAKAVLSPLRLVPFFDPGPWGGQWMKQKFDLPAESPNYAWCFDCVPEENSLMLGFGDQRFETPALNLVLLHPVSLMGDSVFSRFGHDFPIRFDLLDTMGGGNLSFQVHPLTEYIQTHFGMSYTQDESYYLLDAEPDAVVYLGLQADTDPSKMAVDLRRANDGELAFPVDDYANRFPARKHDHFLIPAGTPHCSGAGSMVLEVSATPYIFTFKLWDWNRLGLDGRPRPTHIEDGLKNIQWGRDTAWVRQNLVNVFTPISSGPGWLEERTGLHALEFIETRRHWFTSVVEHDTLGTVHVLNLVEGSGILVESPSNSFLPFAVHYAETFIVPAAVGRYSIRPLRVGERCGTLKAFVRTSPS